MRNEEHRRRLEAGGLTVRGERVLFPERLVEAFVEEVVARNRAREDAEVGTEAQEIRLWVSTYALYVHDLETGRLEPYTSERLVEMCKLVDSLAEEGVSGSVPGIPLDVRPEMQALAQYRIVALYSRQGGRPVDPTSARRSIPCWTWRR